MVPPRMLCIARTAVTRSLRPAIAPASTSLCPARYLRREGGRAGGSGGSAVARGAGGQRGHRSSSRAAGQRRQWAAACARAALQPAAYLVALCSTRSAPSAMACWLMGVANVESMQTTAPCAWQSALMRGMSTQRR